MSQELKKDVLDGIQNVTIGKLAIDIADLKLKLEELAKRIEKLENKKGEDKLC